MKKRKERKQESMKKIKWNTKQTRKREIKKIGRRWRQEIENRRNGE